jgi:hypothetical protein
MKKQTIRLCLIFMSFFFAACLDDDKNPLDPAGTNNVIEFYNIAIPSSANGAVHPLWAVAFDFTPQEEFDIVVSYSGPNSNNKDIDLTIEVDPFALDAYNADQGETYELLPESFYTFNGSVTIPKGQKQATVSITVFPDQFDLSKQYALPLRIVSSSSGIISGNWGAAIYATVAKNQYHGTYHATGYFQHPTAPRPIDQNKTLSTVSADTNLTGLADLGTAMFLTVNPDNTVTFVDGTFGSYPKGTITVDGVTYDNTYDPATKTYFLYYEYIGGTGPRTIYEKLVFVE